MANYFVSYDLKAPEKNYPKIEAAIRASGQALKAHLSLWYVKTPKDLESLCKVLTAAIDPDDRLLVVEATNCQGETMGSSWDAIVKLWTS